MKKKVVEGFYKIDELLERGVRNRIYRAGIELEGGWVKLPPGVTLTHDGSVSIPVSQLGPGGKPINIHVGELPSTPLEVEKVPEFIEQFYPSHVNQSCGLHVHMSFKHAMHYQQLMNPIFQNTILHYVREWAGKEGCVNSHPIWRRLKGESEYCKNEFFADAQAACTSKAHQRGIPGSRYTIVNYCFGLHTTMECRLLPMFEDWKQANRAVKLIFDITNASLIMGAEREEKVEGSLVIDGMTDRLVEDRQEHV